MPPKRLFCFPFLVSDFPTGIKESPYRATPTTVIAEGENESMVAEIERVRDLSSSFDNNDFHVE